MWTTADLVRKLTGLTSDEANDDVLDEYIELAQVDVASDIVTLLKDYVLEGNINGTNSTFTTRAYPIADRDFDLTTGTADVTVYKWGTIGSLDTKEVCVVSSIDPQNGVFYLQSAPATSFDVITVDYGVYPNSINTSLLQRATAFLTGWHYITQEYLLIPKRYSHGAYRYTRAEPFAVLYDRYYQTLDRMIKSHHKKTEHGDVVMIRKGLRTI